MHFSFSFRGKRVHTSVKAVNGFGSLQGLMFSSSACESLLFSFRSFFTPSIHSFFVFFPFYAVWLNQRREIVHVDYVRPFTLRVFPRATSAFLVEIPDHTNNAQITSFLDGVMLSLRRRNKI